MAEKKSWQNGPWQLISFARNTSEDKSGVQKLINEMIVIHNIAIRSINAIYLQSENVGKVGTPKDVADFLEYCAVWVTFLDGHHDEEEEFVFPDIEKLAGVPGLMAGNVEQHKAFYGGLVAFGGYVNSSKSGKEKYDGLKLNEHIDSFMPALYKHLEEEISTLKGLRKFEKVNWKKFWDKTSARIIKKQQSKPDSALIVLPFALCGQDNTFESGIYTWPPFPWVLKQVFRWWFTPKHKDWWRFAPCDADSRPRELPFARL